jgi:hypothetical protein
MTVPNLPFRPGDYVRNTVDFQDLPKNSLCVISQIVWIASNNSYKVWFNPLNEKMVSGELLVASLKPDELNLFQKVSS